MMFFDFVPEKEMKKVIRSNLVDVSEVHIELPKRASACAAGYDFVMPFDVHLGAGEQRIIPTFVRVKLESNMALFIYPRSSCGIKHGIVLANTVGIIDSDYYNNSDNTGHIFIALKNTGKNPVSLPAGTRFAQGIIQEFFLVDGDDFTKGAARKGGIGSTGEA